MKSPMTLRAPRPLCALFAVISTLLCPALLCSPAAAQTKPDKQPPVQIVNIELGWGGVLPGDRWAPVTVWVTSPKNAFDGTLFAEYRQDGTQSSQVAVHVATTPGKVTPVELEVAVPRGCQRLSFTIFDERGRDQAGWIFAEDTSGGELQMPGIGTPNGLFVGLGEITASEAFERFQIHDLNSPQRPGPRPQPTWQSGQSKPDTWESAFFARENVEHLPTSWIAYEGVDVFVARAEDLGRAEPRARAALMDWVRSGGRLVLQVDPAGSDWRAFVSDGDEPISVDPLQRLTAGEALATIVHAQAEGDPVSASARLIHLTPAGIAAGWTVAWPAQTGNAGPTESAAASSGLKATGPVGLGMVTVLGVDPQALPAVIASKVTRAVWRDVLTSTFTPHMKQAGQDQVNSFYWPGWGGEDDQQTATAIHQALDDAADVPPLGVGVFVFIALSMLLLMLLVGPIDAVVLKRLRSRQRSWLTALMWIALASIAAAIAPPAMRSGSTSLKRLTATDVVCDRDGLPVAAAQTSVTGIFGGRSIDVKLEKPLAGAWFRGVSSVERYNASSRSLFSPLTLPIGVADSEPYVRTALPENFSVSQWTYRGLMDQSPLRAAAGTQPGVRVRARPDGAWDVTLINAPAALHTTTATLRIADRRLMVSLNETAPATGLHDLVGVASEETKAPTSFPPAPGATPGSVAVSTTAVAVPVDDRAANLPGTRERSAAIEAMLAGGRWACLTLRADSLPLDLTVSNVPDLHSGRTAYLRLLAPLEK